MIDTLISEALSEGIQVCELLYLTDPCYGTKQGEWRARAKIARKDSNGNFIINSFNDCPCTYKHSSSPTEAITLAINFLRQYPEGDAYYKGMPADFAAKMGFWHPAQTHKPSPRRSDEVLKLFLEKD